VTRPKIPENHLRRHLFDNLKSRKFVTFSVRFLDSLKQTKLLLRTLMRISHCSNKKMSQSWLLWLCLFCSPSFSRLIIPLWLHFTPVPFQPLNQLDEREVFRGNSSCSSLYSAKLRPCPSRGQSWQDTRRPTTHYIHIGLSHTQYTLWPAIRSFRTVSTSSSGQ